MKKFLLSLVVSAMLISAIFAGGNTEASEESLSGTTISFASMNDPFAYVIEQMLPQFTEETGIEVNMDIIPYSALRERTLTDLASGSGSFDLITMDICWMGEWAESGFIKNLDELIARDRVDLDAFVPGALEGLTYWKDEAYGLPIGAYHFLMFYRKDLLDEAGLEFPKTFSDLKKAAEELQDPNDDFYGIAVPMQRGAPVVHYGLAYLSGAGGGLLDADGNVAINSPVAQKVFDNYKDFLSIGPDGMLSYDWFSVSEAFQQDRVAFLGAWDVVAGGFENPEESMVAGKTGYGMMPVLDSSTEGKVPFGGYSLVINKASKKQAAAWEFMKWITSKEVQMEYAMNGGTPVRFDTLESPELQKKYPWYSAVLDIERNGMADATFRPRIPEWPSIEEALGVKLNQAMISEMTVSEALDSLQTEIESILE